MITAETKVYINLLQKDYMLVKTTNMIELMHKSKSTLDTIIIDKRPATIMHSVE